MDKERLNMELIDKYFDGQLTPEEVEVFEGMQREDASFKVLVDDMKLLVGGIRSSARDSLKQEIRQWESKQPDLAGQPGVRLAGRARRFLWISLAAAACLTAFVYVGVFREPRSERIANSVFRDNYNGVFQNTIALTLRSAAQPALALQEGYTAYDNEDFQKAILLFSAAPQKSDTVLFYLGNSWMALKEYGKAGECFRKVMETGHFMVDQSRWFLALTLLKNNKISEAEALFRELSEYRNFYQEKSGEIVSKLSTFH